MRKWKHSMYDDKKTKCIYHSWHNMLKRAGNKNGECPTYVDVTICDRWLNFDNFYDDMAPTWFPHATLDKDIKIPGNRVYRPEACQWVTKSENCIDMHIRRGPTVPKKAVLCIETNTVYDSQLTAANVIGIDVGNLSRVCRGEIRQTGGYHFRYATEDEIKAAGL